MLMCRVADITTSKSQTIFECASTYIYFLVTILMHSETRNGCADTSRSNPDNSIDARG